MNKKAIIGVIVAVVIIAGGVGAYFLWSAGDYVLYSNAFKKTFGVDSMEYSTSVKATLDSTTMNATGNFKLKGMKSSSPQFINTMTISGETITQFCDGEYIYTEDGGSKNKMKIGGGADPTPEPTPQQQGKENEEFSYEAYISEFASLIDATKLKDIGSIEPIDEKYIEKINTSDKDGGKQFDVELNPSIIDWLSDKILSEGSSTSNSPNSPTVVIDAIKYSALVKDGYVSQIAFSLDISVTAAGDTEAQKAVVDLTIKPVNPGKEVSFDLPSTEGF